MSKQKQNNQNAWNETAAGSEVKVHTCKLTVHYL